MRFQASTRSREVRARCAYVFVWLYDSWTRAVLCSASGAEQVAFMDYNKEVLELTTCPNVYKNVHGDANLYAKASFYAGAWASVSEYMQDLEGQSWEQTQYDLILTAETIYTEAVTVELYEVRSDTWITCRPIIVFAFTRLLHVSSR